MASDGLWKSEILRPLTLLTPPLIYALSLTPSLTLTLILTGTPMRNRTVVVVQASAKLLLEKKVDADGQIDLKEVRIVV